MRLSILTPLDAETMDRVDEAAQRMAFETGLKATRTDISRKALREFLDAYLGPVGAPAKVVEPKPKKAPPKKKSASKVAPRQPGEILTAADIDALPNPFD